MPAAEPWEWTRDQQGFSCVQESTGHDGCEAVPAEPGVQARVEPNRNGSWCSPLCAKLAADAGLTEIAAPQDKPGNHDMRISSDDGRTLMFGSREATLITGKIACRRSAG